MNASPPRNVPRHVLGIPPHTGHNRRAVPGQPWQAHGVEAGVVGDAAAVAGVVPFVQYRDVQDAEVEPVAGGPQDGCNALRCQVQPPALRGASRLPAGVAPPARRFRRRRCTRRASASGAGRIRTRRCGEVVAEDEVAVVGCFQVAVQPDAAAAQIPQVEVVAAVGAGQ
ncbi:MAG: hypothetical protein JWN34_3454 [Bryobacterales bacterium]|nr:hypothetical protein [Bryobacterales bacterium]